MRIIMFQPQNSFINKSKSSVYSPNQLFILTPQYTSCAYEQQFSKSLYVLAMVCFNSKAMPTNDTSYNCYIKAIEFV